LLTASANNLGLPFVSARAYVAVRGDAIRDARVRSKSHHATVDGVFDVYHYHLERNHQGLENRLIERSRGQPPKVGRVARREKLGGVLKFYFLEAA